MDISLDTERFNMIQQQIRPWGVIDDRVLDTLAAIPRERFVADAYLGLAYVSSPVRLYTLVLAMSALGVESS
jgi:protein-L-isoaspartate(D-aspartate) O-methyltransferase